MLSHWRGGDFCKSDGYKWYLGHRLKCISLIINRIEHLFLCFGPFAFLSVNYLYLLPRFSPQYLETHISGCYLFVSDISCKQLFPFYYLPFIFLMSYFCYANLKILCSQIFNLFPYCFWILSHTSVWIIKDSIHIHLLYLYNFIFIFISMITGIFLFSFFTLFFELDKTILNFIWKNKCENLPNIKYAGEAEIITAKQQRYENKPTMEPSRNSRKKTWI